MFSFLTYQQWLAVAILVIYVVWKLWPTIKSATSGLAARARQSTLPATITTAQVDDETRAIESAKFLMKWFPPGSPARTAAKVCWSSLFDKEQPGS